LASSGLLGKDRERRDDDALKILRERYARGEINKDEFEAKEEAFGLTFLAYR
jgi:uncharacterized membrane protein